MHFDPHLLMQKLQAIVAKQNDCAYVPKKVRERANKKKQKAIQATNAKQEREISKRVKEIAQARKIKQYEAELGAPIEIDYSIGKKSTPREKRLPTRELNLEEMIPVRIDQKTTVYVKPGADIEAVKAKHRRQPPEKLDEPKVYKVRISKNEMIDDDQVKKLVAMHVPVKQIAKMLEVRPSSVKKIAKYLGLKIA